MSATALIVAFGIPTALALVPGLLATARGRRAWVWFGVAWGLIGTGAGLAVEMGGWAPVAGGLVGWVASLSLVLGLPSRAWRLEREPTLRRERRVMASAA